LLKNDKQENTFVSPALILVRAYLFN
jgi:hypothetical protein